MRIAPWVLLLGTACGAAGSPPGAEASAGAGNAGAFASGGSFSEAVGGASGSLGLTAGTGGLTDAGAAGGGGANPKVSCASDGLPTAKGEWTPPAGALAWSAPATWGGAVPATGVDVTIPQGKTVLLDGTVTVKNLVVEGTLVCDNQDVALRAASIVVHGAFTCGTEDAPFKHQLHITLVGSDPTLDVMGMGAKVFGVMGGTLDLHGERRTSWARLSVNAVAGQAELTLDCDADFRAGDTLVVSSTDFDQDQAEKHVVLTTKGRQITLDAPLGFLHWGTAQAYSNGKKTWSLEERAEVGLLNRNIVIEGDETSLASGFGGHLMSMRGSTMRVSNTELLHMGQQATLARYPLHWHMVGDAPGQYAKNNSIHDTFNRCITIHGTNALTLQSNLCYNNLGHAFFLENGTERDNVLESNLGLLTRRPTPAQMVKERPSDRADRGHDPVGPATYWISNPNNTLRNNVSAGSDGSGFWYGLNSAPIGLNSGEKVSPIRLPVKEFTGNVTHSVAGMAMVIGDASMDGPGSVYQPTSASVFSDSSYYKTRARGVWAHAFNTHFENFVMADGVRGAFFSFTSQLTDSVIIGESKNTGTPKSALELKAKRSLADPTSGGVAGYVLYDGPVKFHDVHFAGFDRDAPNVYVFANNGAATHHMDNQFDEISFAPDTKRIYPDAISLAEGNGQRHASIYDVDGTVSARPGSYVLPNFPFNTNENCKKGPWTSDLWTSCLNHYLVATLVTPGQLGLEIQATRSDGPTTKLINVTTAIYQMGVIADSKYRYRYDFPAGKFPSNASLRLLGLGTNSAVVFELSPAPAAVGASVGGQALPVAPSLAGLESSATRAQFRSGSSLFIKVFQDATVSLK